MQGLLLSYSTDTAWYALAARLVSEECRDTPQNRFQINRVVENHNHARSESGVSGARALERQFDVEFIRPNKHPGCAAEEHAPKRPALGHTARHFDEIPKFCTVFNFVHSGELNASRKTKQARARR